MIPVRRSSVASSAPSASPGTLVRRDELDFVNVNELHGLLVRQRISNMFRRYVPTKLHRLDIALMRYHGKEESLLRSLVAKFGPEPTFTAEQQRLSDSIHEALATRRSHGRQSNKVDYVDPSAHPRARCRGDGAATESDGEFSEEIEPQRCSASPRSVSNSGDKFQAAVAIVAHHQQVRTRLLETYSAKRTIIRMQEEKERDGLHRLMATDHRHLSSTLNRRHAESLLFVQRERSLALEQQLAAKRQEEARIAWVQGQAAQCLQKAMSKRDDVLGLERQERRVLLQQYNEERAKQYRHEKRVARLRDAAEGEAQMQLRGFDDGARTDLGTPLSHRSRLESALAESPLDLVLGSPHVVAHSRGDAGGKRALRWSSPDACDENLSDLMNQLGTAVTSSIGGPGVLLPCIASPQPKIKYSMPIGAPSSSPMTIVGNHWAADPQPANTAFAPSPSSKGLLALSAPARQGTDRGAALPPVIVERKRRRAKKNASNRRGSRAECE